MLPVMADALLYLTVAVLAVVLVTAALAGVKAAPYVPTFQRDVDRMLHVADVREGETVVDLGAGDGRFLITAAKKYKARGVGYELSLLLYVIALLRVLIAGVGRRVTIRYGDFYRASLRDADVVCCFLTPYAMKRLEPKFDDECKRSARVVSYAFKLPHRSADSISKPTPRSAPVFLYRY